MRAIPKEVIIQLIKYLQEVYNKLREINLILEKILKSFLASKQNKTTIIWKG